MMFAYFALATGFTLPEKYGFNIAYSVFILLINTIICIFFSKSVNKLIFLTYTTMGLACLVLLGINVNSLTNNSLIIAFSSYIIPIIVSYWLYCIKEHIGENNYLDLWIYCALLILFITILYKINYGFFDRSVRFFLNGPIVFGWLYATFSVISIYQLTTNPSLKRYLFSIFFVLATLWTLSMGPLIALFFGIFLIVILNLRLSYRLIMNIILLMILMYISFIYIQDSRIGERLELILNAGLLNYYQSSPRYQFVMHSINLLENNYLFGTGIDSFSYMSFTYPHNIIFNLLLDGGIIYTSIFLVLLIIIFTSTNNLGKVILLMSILALMFSGNTTYLRFIFILPITLIFNRYKMLTK